MISNPKYGWCDFTLGNWFSGRASYLTDVPMDLLDAFIDYHKNGYGVVVFDSEGEGTFTLVMTLYNLSIYIIEEREERTIHFLDDFRFEDLERDLILDIERELDGWARFTADTDDEEARQRSLQLRAKVRKLRVCRGENEAFLVTGKKIAILAGPGKSYKSTICNIVKEHCDALIDDREELFGDGSPSWFLSDVKRRIVVASCENKKNIIIEVAASSDRLSELQNICREYGANCKTFFSFDSAVKATAEDIECRAKEILDFFQE